MPWPITNTEKFEELGMTWNLKMLHCMNLCYFVLTNDLIKSLIILNKCVSAKEFSLSNTVCVEINCVNLIS